METSIYLAILATIFVLLANLQITETLAYCPQGCLCDDENLVVKCDEGDLDVLPIALNPSIQRLIIKKNKIKVIDSAIQFYNELTYFECSYNHLVVIPQRTFLFQKKLRELHLSHNKIGFISNETFQGLTELTVLNLQENFLDELSKGTFKWLAKLEELNLSKNRISRIDPNAFDGLTNLRILYLEDNTLTSVPSASFIMLKNLAELNLGINSFSTIPKGAFQDLKGLTRLDLKGAALFNISSESFKGLEALRILDLSDNRLRRIPTVELSTLSRLEHLSLGQNDFEVVPEGAFVGLTNLRKIEISASLKLKKIEAGAFGANSNLETIIITSNKALSEVQEGALSGLPRLKHVILKDNSLTTLAEGLFPWSDLDVLDLSENPIRCDCHMVWLKNILQVRNNGTTAVLGSHQPAPVLCASPERLREEQLRILSPELLGCAYSDSKRQAMIGLLLVGCAAIITALALILFKFRRGIRELLKGRWGNNALRRKEKEYQKTFSDEEYVSRYQYPCNFCSHPALNNFPHHHNQHPVGVRPMPITEL